MIGKYCLITLENAVIKLAQSSGNTRRFIDAGGAGQG